ncbi:MAG TPA: hypothetical protein VNH38_03320 [Candidatus Dormibacteraeota bacterium]|nr:hypothetical protein [Candidatus Dormibacteraeota bacterium]
MNYNIVIVPPGGGEVDFGQEVKGATHVPRPGEYVVISVVEGDERARGAEAYKVRYAVTHLTRRQSDHPEFVYATVEVEPVRHAMQSKDHADMCKRYDGHWGHPTEDYPTSGY